MLRNLILAAALAAGLAACATATPYQPNLRANAVTGGFSELRIEQDRWRVNFAGNSLTSRERVETYLLYRAAELTLEQGYDSFEIVDRDVDRDSRVYVDRVPGFGARYSYGYWSPYFRPHWRYRGVGFGWRSWNPWYGDPFWGDRIDVRQVDRFEATAEIVMRRGGDANDPKVFTAREVVENLRPTIQYPGEPRRY